MGVINQPEDLLTRIRDLERQVKELRRGSLSNAAISSGALEVRTPDGFLIARIGEFDADGTPATGMEIYRRSGGLQARFFDTTGAGGGGYWAMFDEAGHVIMSEDTVSGEGLATPYIPYTAQSYANMLSPPVLTTSATFANMHRIEGPKQHPYIRVKLLTDSDADTTGEVILVQGGSQIGGTVTVPLNDNSYRWIDAPVTGSHMSDLTVDVQARRTAGTGNVRVGIAFAVGRQS